MVIFHGKLLNNQMVLQKNPLIQDGAPSDVKEMWTLVYKPINIHELVRYIYHKP